jgi:integrase/recombinase XerD
MTVIAPALESFFTQRLMTQQQASAHTIASYRDTFRLLLGYAREQTGKLPGQLDFADLDAPLISGFLNWLETSRGNSAATRNNRLAAIRSFLTYASLQAPEHAALITRALAIPAKRHDQATVSFLTRTETQALLAAPGTATWHARRDHALLTLAAQTGLRVSELTSLTIADARLGTGPHVHCKGKGRKERCTPLTAQTIAVLTTWLDERRGSSPDPLFCTRSGGPLSRDAVERLLTKYVTIAAGHAHLFRAKPSHPTHCATRPPWPCSTPASTSP